MRRRRAALAMFLALSLIGTPGFGATEKEKAAQQAFDEALTLLKTKRYAEACAKLAQSQELDPGMGTQFRLAECYEKLGRFASAYEQYMAVANAANAENKNKRALLASKRATALESKIARLTIDVSPSVASLPGIEVRRDGVVVEKVFWGQAVPVDRGDHVVTVQAPRRLPFESKLWADAAAKLVVSVAALESPALPKPKPRSKIPLLALGGAGVVGVGLGITFVALRAGEISDAQALRDKVVNGEGNCRANGPAEFATDCSTLLAAAQRGDTFGTGSIVSFIVGGAALGAAAGYFFWPEAKPVADREGALYILPMLGPGATGLTVSGVF
jgi:tetratricopeptide (TPR) repeat protein